MLTERVDVWDGEIEMQLLRHSITRPGRPGQLRDLLEGEPGVPGWILQDKPILATNIWLTRRWRLVAGAIFVAQ